MSPRQNFFFKHFKSLIEGYDGSKPFHHYFRNYCTQNKALGSRDRKLLRELVFCIYRTGNAWRDTAIETLFLWPAKQLTLREDVVKLYEGLTIDVEVPEFKYPFDSYLDSSIEKPAYFQSFSQQPYTWVRLAKRYKDRFLKQFEADILVETPLNDGFISFGLKNGTQLEVEGFPVIVQDRSSQVVCSKIEVPDGAKVWDCCAGSGGKSLYMVAAYPGIDLCVSDIRPGILQNLKQRFKTNQLWVPPMFTMDLTNMSDVPAPNGKPLPENYFDVIVADVPCSGSGTWAREPEHLSYFDEAGIKDFSARQKVIADNAVRYLKPGGLFYYITCSVFTAENQEVVNSLVQNNLVSCLSTELVCGFTNNADNLFVAVLKKL